MLKVRELQKTTEEMLKFFILLIVITYCQSEDQTSCNFEKDFCGYNNTGPFVRYAGKSPSPSSGPSTDHTYGDSYYGLCDAMQLRDPSDKCELFKQVTIEKESIFEFWYYMWGFHIGTLELIANDEVVWSRTDRQQNAWLLAEVILREGNYELKFSANRSEEDRLSGDIAIDDLMLEGQTLSTNLATVTRTSAMPVANISDDFDSDIPSWSTEYTFNRWEQLNGNESDHLEKRGPASDYSAVSSNINLFNGEPDEKCSLPFALPSDPRPYYYCQSVLVAARNFSFVCGQNPYPIPSFNTTFISCKRGNYLMVTNEKFENDAASSRARLFSRVFSLTSRDTKFCLSFKYNIYSESTDGLRVGIENYENHAEFDIVFAARGPRVNRWYSGAVEISRSFAQNRIFFEPRRGVDKNEFASVSIDSININYGDCDPDLFEPTPEVTTVEETTVPETTTAEEAKTSDKEITTARTEPESTTIALASSSSSMPSSATTTTTTTTTSTTTTTTTRTTSTSTTTTTIEIEDKKESSSDTLAIVLGIVIPVVVLGIAAGVLFYLKRTGQICASSASGKGVSKDVDMGNL